MRELARHYPDLQRQGYEVVSVSADIDSLIYRNNVGQYPWAYKHCDLKGFVGKDFRNYGVIGTPTFYVLDAKSIVQSRLAQVEDIAMIISGLTDEQICKKTTR